MLVPAALVSRTSPASSLPDSTAPSDSLHSFPVALVGFLLPGFVHWGVRRTRKVPASTEKTRST